jgi:hypothetical protein
MNNPSDNSLLTEYQVCQNDINSLTSNYWVLSSIFIGIVSALLAGAIFGVLGNDEILRNVLCERCLNPSVLYIRIIVTFFGIASIAILYLLKRWTGRVNYLIHMNHFRMHQIE